VGQRLKVGFAAHLFFDHMHLDHLHAELEERLSSAEPEVELLACERVAADRLRLVIDHPDGVDLDLCERVTGHLRDVLVHYGLEVSSPGPRRPLTRPDHFRRFLGRRAKLRLRSPRDGRRSLTGELVGASDEEVTMAVGTAGGRERAAAQSGIVSIPYAEINKGNLVEER
jgi:ribosome maturation factor RimP